MNLYQFISFEECYFKMRLAKKYIIPCTIPVMKTTTAVAKASSAKSRTAKMTLISVTDVASVKAAIIQEVKTWVLQPTSVIQRPTKRREKREGWVQLRTDHPLFSDPRSKNPTAKTSASDAPSPS